MDQENSEYYFSGISDSDENPHSQSNPISIHDHDNENESDTSKEEDSISEEQEEDNRKKNYLRQRIGSMINDFLIVNRNSLFNANVYDSRRSRLRLIDNYNPFNFTHNLPMQIFESSDNEVLNCLNFNSAYKKIYGSLAIHSLRKMQEQKLAEFSMISGKIYKKVLEIYNENIQKERESPKLFFNKSRCFMKCIPSLKCVKRFLKRIEKHKKNKKNVYFLKLCMDIYEDYLKTLDFPMYKKYTKCFLPLAIKFYSNMSEDNMKFINEQISYIKSIKFRTFKTFEFKTSKEIVDYYIKEYSEYSCLTAATKLSQFVM